MLLGKNIDGVLHGISGDHDAVIGFGVAGMFRLALGARGGFRNSYEVSISPSNNTPTVISTTSCVPASLFR